MLKAENFLVVVIWLLIDFGKLIGLTFWHKRLEGLSVSIDWKLHFGFTSLNVPLPRLSIRLFSMWFVG
jgi:hypothetical protein